MRPEENPLDLNNLPDEHSRDGNQVLHDSSSSGCRKNKNGLKDAKEECGKVYECRFCSLKFCKSQALGGHMNRHRQERETETLNQARQLVYRNDHSLTTQGAPNLGTGCCQPMASSGGSYHPATTNNMGDPTMRLRFPRYMSSSSPIHMPTTPTAPPPPPPPSQLQHHHHQQPSQNLLYTSPPRALSFPSHYTLPHPPNEYYVGHVLSIGASMFGGGGAKDRSLQNQEEGVSWGRSCSAINRFQDGF